MMHLKCHFVCFFWLHSDRCEVIHHYSFEFLIFILIKMIDLGINYYDGSGNNDWRHFFLTIEKTFSHIISH